MKTFLFSDIFQVFEDLHYLCIKTWMGVGGLTSSATFLLSWLGDILSITLEIYRVKVSFMLIICT